MVKESYSAEVPNYGDWSKGSHEINWSRLVYQRKYWLPKLLCIKINLLNQEDNIYTFKFSLDTVLSTDEPNFNEDLLFHCNLLQENIGACDVFAADSADEEYIQTLYVEWELLPPGKRDAYIVSTPEYF